jgi:hypothetical protein
MMMMMMMMSVEQSVEWLAEETEILEENLLQCRLVNQKFHMVWPKLEPGQPRYGHKDDVLWLHFFTNTNMFFSSE